MTFRRLDVFGTSGAAGKTVLSVRLAQLHAEHTKRPVLLVDADITGPCLGDVLEHWIDRPWSSVNNLVHLVCGRPELLPDKLRRSRRNAESDLPVYVWREKRPIDPSQSGPQVASSAAAGKPLVLFCPSNPNSTRPLSDELQFQPSVLHALLGHESAGGWVNHVIDLVVEATESLLGEDGKQEGHALGGVIVDHGPTMGALPWATLEGCLEAQDERSRPIFVTTLSRLQLVVVSETARRICKSFGEGALDQIQWVVNQVPSDQMQDRRWQTLLRERHAREQARYQGRRPVCPGDGWYEHAIAVRQEPGLGAFSACDDVEQFLCAMERYKHSVDPAHGDMDALWKKLFGT